MVYTSIIYHSHHLLALKISLHVFMLQFLNEKAPSALFHQVLVQFPIARLNVLYHLGTGREYHMQQIAGVKIMKNSEPWNSINQRTSCSIFLFNALFISSKLWWISLSIRSPVKNAPRPVKISRWIIRTWFCASCSIVNMRSPFNRPGSKPLPYHLSSWFGSIFVKVGLYVLFFPLDVEICISSLDPFTTLPLISRINGFQSGKWAKSVRTCQTFSAGAFISISVLISFKG